MFVVCHLSNHSFLAIYNNLIPLFGKRPFICNARPFICKPRFINCKGRPIICTPRSVSCIGRPSICKRRPISCKGRSFICTPHPINCKGRPYVCKPCPFISNPRPINFIGRSINFRPCWSSCLAVVRCLSVGFATRHQQHLRGSFSFLQCSRLFNPNSAFRNPCPTSSFRRAKSVAGLTKFYKSEPLLLISILL